MLHPLFALAVLLPGQLNDSLAAPDGAAPMEVEAPRLDPMGVPADARLERGEEAPPAPIALGKLVGCANNSPL